MILERGIKVRISGAVNGRFVRVTYDRDTVYGDTYWERVVWCKEQFNKLTVEQLTGKNTPRWFCYEDAFHFSKEEDAIAFVLRWS